MSRGDQLTRQWKLVQLLAGRYGRTLAQLRAELGVGKRTVQRDLAVLQAADFPLTSESCNGTVRWRFMEGFRAGAPVSLTLTEQMALYFAKGLFRPLQGTPVHESLESALQKIGSGLPAQSFQLLRGLDDAISVRTLGFKDYSRSKDVMDALTRSILHKFTTRITHCAARFEKGIEREVDPYRLWYVNNGIYLIGHDHRSGEMRTFAVERISAAKATRRRFEIPDDFDFEKFTESAFNVIYGEPQEVKIRFSRGQAPYIEERTWHPSQKIEKRGDGSVELTLQVGNLWEIKRWLIGYGADAHVLAPDGLRNEIEQGCARLLKMRRRKKINPRGSIRGKVKNSP